MIHNLSEKEFFKLSKFLSYKKKLDVAENLKYTAFHKSSREKSNPSIFPLIVAYSNPIERIKM